MHADGVDAANAPRNRCVSENFTADKEKAAIGGANVSNMNASAPGYMSQRGKPKKIQFVNQRIANSEMDVRVCMD